MDKLDRRIRRVIDDRLETTIQRRLDIFVDQVMEMMDTLMGNENGNCYHSRGNNPTPMVIFYEEEDFSSDVEEEECEGDVDEDIEVIEADSKLIFYSYPLEDEFMLGDEETVLADEPLFDTFSLEKEFMSGGEKMVIYDEPVFDAYTSKEEVIIGEEEAVIDDKPILIYFL